MTISLACQKLGNVVKTSNWKTLEAVSHYHQPAGCHPQGAALPDYYEKVEVVTGGRGWIRDQVAWREVGPGDVIWNQPGDCTIGRSDFADPYRCLAVTFITRRKRGSGMPRFSHWPDGEEVRVFTRECVRLFFDDRFDRRVLFDYVLGRLIFRVKVHGHETGRRGLPSGILAVMQKIERDYAGPCRLEELATVAGWSVAHLHEVFREKLEITPHRFLMQHRLRVARERLASTNQPVKQIAVECGFADAAAFSHAFKAAMGGTPRQYRERSLRPG